MIVHAALELQERQDDYYQEMVEFQGGYSQVRIEPPLNWYEDNHFLGFAFFSIYHRGAYLDDPDHFYLRLRGDPDEIVDDFSISSWHNCCQINDGSDQLWVALYPKNAIPNKYNRNQPGHFLAAIDVDSLINYPSTCTHIMRCGVQLIYHPYHDVVGSSKGL